MHFFFIYILKNRSKTRRTDAFRTKRKKNQRYIFYTRLLVAYILGILFHRLFFIVILIYVYDVKHIHLYIIYTIQQCICAMCIFFTISISRHEQQKERRRDYFMNADLSVCVCVCVVCPVGKSKWEKRKRNERTKKKQDEWREIKKIGKKSFDSYLNKYLKNEKKKIRTHLEAKGSFHFIFIRAKKGAMHFKGVGDVVKRSRKGRHTHTRINKNHNF